MGSYTMITRRVVEAYLRFNDYRKAYVLTLQWLGFHSVSIPVVHDDRFAGNSSYSFTKLLHHAVHYIVDAATGPAET